MIKHTFYSQWFYNLCHNDFTNSVPFFHKVYINFHKTCTMKFIGPSTHVYYAAISTPDLYCDLYKICTHFTCSYANSRDDHSLTISWPVNSSQIWNQSIFCPGLRVSPNSRSYPSFISWANLATDLTHPLFHWIHLQYVTKCKPTVNPSTSHHFKV